MSSSFCFTLMMTYVQKVNHAVTVYSDSMLYNLVCVTGNKETIEMKRFLISPILFHNRGIKETSVVLFPYSAGHKALCRRASCSLILHRKLHCGKKKKREGSKNDRMRRDEGQRARQMREKEGGE